MNEDTGRDPDSGRSRRRTFVILVTLAAIGLAIALFCHSFDELRYDSFHYFTLSRIVSTEGLWNLHSRVRTYGFPLFVSLCTGFSDPDPRTTRTLVFAVQLVLYLGVSLYAARVVERVFSSRRSFFGTYLLMALNPIALARATELLSDFLSAVLVLLAVLLSLETGRGSPRAFLAFLCAGLSVAVRPANLIVLPGLALVWLLRGRLYGERPGRTLSLGAAAVLLALTPQIHSNATAYDAWTPLLPDPLYKSQVGWGMSILKYATLVVPDRPPQIVYRNPFYPPDVASPAEFFRRRPVGYLATLSLHGFALVDQDFLFTYVTGVDRPYRWPLSIGNYAFFFLAALGVGIGLRRVSGGLTAEHLYFVSTAAVCLPYVALYLPVAVESRFSLPLYLLLAPAVVAALIRMSAWRPGARLAVLIGGGAFVAGCVELSIWLAAQAPVLVELAGR